MAAVLPNVDAGVPDFFSSLDMQFSRFGKSIPEQASLACWNWASRFFIPEEPEMGSMTLQNCASWSWERVPMIPFLKQRDDSPPVDFW